MTAQVVGKVRTPVRLARFGHRLENKSTWLPQALLHVKDYGGMMRLITEGLARKAHGQAFTVVERHHRPHLCHLAMHAAPYQRDASDFTASCSQAIQ
jgi:hypothetical protein